MDPELAAAQQLVASLRASSPPPTTTVESANPGSPSASATPRDSPKREDNSNPKAHLDFAKRILAAAFKRPSEEAPGVNTHFAPGRLFFSFDLSQRSSGPPHVIIRNARGNTAAVGAQLRPENDNAAFDAAIREIRRRRERRAASDTAQPSQTLARTPARPAPHPNPPVSVPMTQSAGRSRSTDNGSDCNSDIFGDAGSDYELELDVEAAAAPLDESASLPGPPTTLTDHSALPTKNPASSTAVIPQKRRHHDIPDDLDAADLDLEMAGAQAGAMGFSRTVVESDEDSDEDLKTLSHLKEQVQHKLATSGVFTAEAPRKAKRQKRDHTGQSEDGNAAGPSKSTKSS